MTGVQEQLGIYLHLAQASERRHRPLVRDKFLVLAAECASELALDQIADFCRKRILENNPGHLLRKYASYGQAMLDENFHTYLKQLHRAYPLEKAEFMLASLGIDPANERAAYFSDHEYAAALLGTTPEELDNLFSGVPAAATSAPAKPSLNLDTEPDSDDREGFDLFEFQASQSDEYSRSDFRELLKPSEDNRPVEDLRVPGITTPGAQPDALDDDDDDMEDDEESRQVTAESEAELKTGIKPPGSNGHAPHVEPAAEAPVPDPLEEEGPTAGASPAHPGQPLKDDPRAKPGLKFDELNLRLANEQPGDFDARSGGLEGSEQLVFSDDDSSESTLGPADMAAIIGNRPRREHITDDEPSVDASISALASDLVPNEDLMSGSGDMTVAPRMSDAVVADELPRDAATTPSPAPTDALSALRALAADPMEDSMDAPIAELMEAERLANEVRPAEPVALVAKTSEEVTSEEVTPEDNIPQKEAARASAEIQAADQLPSAVAEEPRPEAAEPAPAVAESAAAEPVAAEAISLEPAASVVLEPPAKPVAEPEPEPEPELVAAAEPVGAVAPPDADVMVELAGPALVASVASEPVATAPAAVAIPTLELAEEPTPVEVTAPPERARKPDMDADIFAVAASVAEAKPVEPVAPPETVAEGSDDVEIQILAPQKRKPRRKLPPVVFTADSVDLELGITEVELPPPEPEPEEDPNVLFADLAEHKAKPSDSFVGTTLGLFQATEFKHRPAAQPAPTPTPPSTPAGPQQPVTSFPAYLPQTEPKYLPPQPGVAPPSAPAASAPPAYLPSVVQPIVQAAPPPAPITPLPPPTSIHSPAPSTPAPAPAGQDELVVEEPMDPALLRSPLRTPVAHVAAVTPAIIFVGGLPANAMQPAEEAPPPAQDDGTIELESDDGDDDGDNVIAASAAMALRGELLPEDPRFDEGLETSDRLRETPTYTPSSPAAAALAAARAESALEDVLGSDRHDHDDPDSEETDSVSAISQVASEAIAAATAKPEPAKVEAAPPAKPATPELPARAQNVAQLADTLRPTSPEWTPSHMAEPASQGGPWLLIAIAGGVFLVAFVALFIAMQITR